MTRTEPNSQLLVAPVASPDRGTAVRTGPERLDAPAFSPDAGRVAYQMMTSDDWELFTVKADGSGEQRLTREIQHDVLPRFLGNDRLLGLIGEAAPPPVVRLRPRLRQRGCGSSTTTPCGRSRRSTSGSRTATAPRC